MIKNNNTKVHLIERSKKHCNGFERFVTSQMLLVAGNGDRLILSDFSKAFCSRHNLTKDALIDSLRLLAKEDYVKINWRAHEPNIVLDRNRCEELVRR